MLIVEDEPSIGDLIAMNLELVGHTSTQAFDSDEALDSLKIHTYDDHYGHHADGLGRL
ncbi:hypothetical protein ACHHV8_15680 [Paenibacillus sp. TAB 01]|uniref:hypothetical protein n=1 Tax=Paenibacillus sp. TAB 01 TaxID=3368988 RepID=UPI003751161D